MEKAGQKIRSKIWITVTWHCYTMLDYKHKNLFYIFDIMYVVIYCIILII